jgi:biopolymer transport protein ExbD
MNHQISFAAIVISVLLATGCDKDSSAPAPAAAPTPARAATDDAVKPKVEIKVMANGAVLLDDKPVSVEAVDERLAELEKVKGVVWYYREVTGAEPPPVAMEIMKLVVKHGLPITMSTKPDFSDAVDGHGVSQPRR